MAADAADIFEVRGWTRPGRWRQLPIALRPDGSRSVTTAWTVSAGPRTSAFEPATAPNRPGGPEVAGSPNAGWVRLTWAWRLAPGEARELFLGRVDPRPPRTADDVLFPAPPRVATDVVAASYHAWNRGFADMRTDNELFNLAISRSAGDLRLLLNDGPGPHERYLAAGVPWFATLFGRDAILASLQALSVRPQLAVETLEVLAALQATDDDPTRDAEPGKILHELRTGEMARDGEIPHRPTTAPWTRHRCG